MNNKENQHVKLSSILGVLALSLVLLLMLSLPSSAPWNESKALRARQKAEILGYQLVQLYQENLKSSSDSLKNVRSIASVDTDLVEFKPEGLMGLDPWGQPYRYIIQKAEKDQVRVVIWSMGPNQKDDSEESTDKKLFSPKSDDIQIVLNLPVGPT